MSQDRLDDAIADLGPAHKVLSGGRIEILNFARNGAAPESKVLERYAVVPSLANPRVLLPLDASNRAWTAILRQHATGAASPIARAAARTLGVMSRFGLMPLLLRNQVSVVTDGFNLTETPLHGFLGDLLGRKDFVTSLRIAPRRPNGKPVVQAVAHNGTVLAYAKFGWEDLTQRLIRHEADVLNELATLTRGMPLRVPAVLHSGRWCGLEALVLAPLPGMGKTPRSSTDVPIGAAVALAGLGTRVVQRLGDSAFWRRTISQVVEVAPLFDDKSREVVLAACSTISDRWGDTEVPMGRNHGDWIPPNISIRDDGAFNVWDWERSEHDVPLGIDTMQFILFVELQRRCPTWIMARRIGAFGQAALARHGLEPQMTNLLSMLTLLRSVLWYGEARAAGREQGANTGLIRILETLVDQSRAGSSRQPVYKTRM
jgi:hypothetical protein